MEYNPVLNWVMVASTSIAILTM